MPLFQQGTLSALGGLFSQDYGISERLGIGRPNPAVTSRGALFYNPNQAKAQTPQVLGTSSSYGQSMAPIQSKVPIGPTYRGPVSAPTGGGGGAAPVQQQPAGNPIMEQNINQQVNDLGAIIDRDFETALNDLSGQEQNLRGIAITAEQAVQAQAGKAKTSLGTQRDVAQQGLGKEEQTAQRQSSSAIQQAREIAREIERRNQAQLSSLGISSSSVFEALAEKLGVETARRIAGVTGSRDEILQNIAAERSRIINVFQQKVADLEQSVISEISNIQNNLLSGLRQINSARQAAASDKANARQQLLSNAQNEIAKLRSEAANFTQQQQLAAQKRQSSLDESLNLLTAQPQDFSNLISNVNAISPALQSAGLQFSNISPQGGFSIAPTQISRGTNEDDELENAISAISG